MLKQETTHLISLSLIDYKTVEYLMTVDRHRIKEVILFYCQQASEKALKAYLTEHNIDFKWIHDLTKLLASCKSVSKAFSNDKLYIYCSYLTPFAVITRYGSGRIINKFTMDDVHKAVRAMKRICNAVFKELDVNIN
ncbi:MAG: HEPN domain-containing protein [Oscillospiraceae bacterium]|nr:HEPN domain-containing protein [Oscillospiraceae bacterium]